MTDTPRPGVRVHHFGEQSIDLPDTLTEAQIDCRACICCGNETIINRPVEAWSERSSQVFQQCVDAEACDRRQSPDEVKAVLAAALGEREGAWASQHHPCGAFGHGGASHA